MSILYPFLRESGRMMLEETMITKCDWAGLSEDMRRADMRHAEDQLEKQYKAVQVSIIIGKPWYSRLLFWR